MSVVIKGEKKLMDTEGNVYHCKVQSIRGTDKGFTKVWLADFMAKLNLIGNKKLKVAFWLVEHANRDNYIIYSQREIAKKMNTTEKSKIGLSTISETMKELQKADFIRKVGQVYMLNPAVLSKTYSADARQAILTEYFEGTEGDSEYTNEEKIKNINRTIKELEERKLNLIAADMIDKKK